VRRPTRRALLLGAVGALAAAVAIERLWKTDEERVVEALDALQEGLEARDVARIEPWVTRCEARRRRPRHRAENRCSGAQRR
jgi:hypothetical protein